jgi:hypothetical protein
LIINIPGKARVLDLGRELDPLKALRLLSPEPVGVSFRALEHGAVLLGIDQRVRCQLGLHGEKLRLL